ncbi:MAG: rhodanese-like domain-containing protein [Acidimicrobiia bacterium]
MDALETAEARPGVEGPGGGQGPARVRSNPKGAVLILILGTLVGVGFGLLIWSWGTDDASQFRRGYLAIGPTAFEQRLERGETFVVKVGGGPGEIEGTDVRLGGDRIAGHPELPEDKDDELLIYSADGRASERASRTLREDGYTDIVDLKGGVAAWERSGRAVVEP